MAQCCLLEYAKEVTKCLVTEALWPPIKRHIDYWWSFGDNIQGLRDETDCLERERRNMEQKIKEARLRAESVTPEVGNWSNKCTQKLEEARRTLQSGDELKPVNIISRYWMGKSAKETAEGIAKLRSEGNLITISDPADPPSMGPIRHEPTMEFGSRGRIEEDIMDSLKGEHARVIAICGGGGVGKTTMVQRIEDRVRKENLFDEVVHVVVSQQFDVLKIQKEIAGLLGLNLIEDTLAARAHKLHIRLVDSKRKLIVFDDVWKRLNLTDFGVPLGNDFGRCKIILTSRVEDACKKMNAQNIIRIDVLTEDEAWALFKEKAGSCVEGSDLRLVAEDVAKECKGLPLALVIVGEALKDQSIHVWRDSLSQLRRAMPSDFPEVLEDVYKPLKLSYDFMENGSVKSLFLICCLFPEDYDIPIELLTLYSIGLGVFEGIRNIEEGRSRTHSFVEKLKSRFLLMDDSWQHYVNMHDVVRDVAIFIGSKERNGFLKSMEVSTMRSSSKDLSYNCNWMSIDISIENAKLPVGSDFPNLRLLIIRGSHSRYGKPSQVFDATVIYFEGMEELNVLSFSNINLRSLPPTLALLKKLTTLHLEYSTVEDISVVCELASLEILCIRKCDSIEELPADFGRLNRLRLLEVNYCRHLKRVAAGVISSLVRLEELKIIGWFDKWEAKGNQSEERNASLSELEFLPNLTCLEIDLSDCNLLAQEICLPRRLVRYQLRSSGDTKFGHLGERHILLTLPGDFAVGNWIHQLVSNTQSLELVGDGSNNFNLADYESLRNLVLVNCSTMKKLANAIDCKFHMLEELKLSKLTEFEDIIDGTVPEGSKSFENLEKLHVEGLPKLTHLWKSLNQDVSLGKLNVISINGCPNLRYLFSVATGRSLVQLRQLEIVKCGRIEKLFWNEIESNTDASSIIEFPKLEELILDQLPNLVAFSQGVEIVEFPRLANLKIRDCPKLRLKIGKCPNLVTIDVSTFNDVHHFLTSCCTRKWNTKLKQLVISNCGSIEEVLWDEIEDEENRGIIFPELWRLELSDLPRLTTLFYRGVETIKFAKLRMMKIGNLPRLNSLLPMDSEPSHDEHSLHFFCNQKVEIPCLYELHISNFQDAISKIWCCHIPNNLFDNLWILRISDVNGIRNLMSSSIAKNLVNLYELCIEGCQEMVEVIEDDKEIFVTSLFPKLEWLEITKLQKLRSFCQWKHAFEFPSLETVEIDDCPAMRTFSLGSLSTPNLFEFKINGIQFEMKDLNGGTHDHFTTKGQEGDKDLEYSCENKELADY